MVSISIKVSSYFGHVTSRHSVSISFVSSLFRFVSFRFVTIHLFSYLVSYFARYLFRFLWEESLLEVLPQDAEQYSLHTVGEDFRFESAEHEAGDAGFLHDVLDDLRVGDLRWVGLLVYLADTDGVGAGVANGRRAKANNGPASELGQLVVLLWDFGAQEVVDKEPGVVADKGCRGGREGSVVEGQWSRGFDLVGDGREPTSYLHRGLYW